MSEIGEIKSLLEEQFSDWETEWKAAVDQQNKEIEKFGESSAETEAKLDAINQRFDQIDVQLQRAAASESKRSSEDRAEHKQLINAWARNVANVDNPAFTGDPAIQVKVNEQGQREFYRNEQKVLTVAQDPTGGFLAPPEFVAEIIKGVVLISPLRSLAAVRQTNFRSAMIPNRAGTFAAQWTTEQGTRTETTGLKYGLQEITTYEMYALVDVSQQDLEDSAFDLEAQLNSEFAEQFAKAEGTAFVAGTGVNQPEGVITNTSVLAAYSPLGGASTITADGLLTLASALKTAYVAGASWILTRKSLYAVRKLKDSQNRYLWQPSLVAGNPGLIDNTPYTEMPDMPEINTNTFSIALGNWQKGYQIVDRVQMQMQRDPYTQATAGNIRFICRKRVGGQVVLPEAIQLGKVATS